MHKVKKNVNTPEKNFLKNLKNGNSDKIGELGGSQTSIFEYRTEQTFTTACAGSDAPPDAAGTLLRSLFCAVFYQQHVHSHIVTSVSITQGGLSVIVFYVDVCSMFDEPLYQFQRFAYNGVMQD